jgi:histidinol-phosphatase (PHP family)
MKDGHVHSHYCLHGSDDTFQMYIENAIKAGIDEISFTEHFPLPRGFEDPSPQKDSSMDVEELEKYIKELQIVKKFYSGVIKINIGVEVDYIEGFEEKIKELLNKYGKDFEDSILSVHMVKYNSKYYCIDYDKDSFGELVDILGGVDKVYDLYYDTLKKAINSDLGMYKPKRIGHLNLVRRGQSFKI